MLETQIYSKDIFRRERYENGQLALFLDDQDGNELAELSIAFKSLLLGRDEIILRDFSDDLELAENLEHSGIISKTDRFVLIGSYVCPICEVLI